MPKQYILSNTFTLIITFFLKYICSLLKRSNQFDAISIIYFAILQQIQTAGIDYAFTCIEVLINK